MRPIWLVALFSLLSLPAHAYRMTAWVPSWDANALTTLQTEARHLDEANPGWYTIAADGSVKKNWGAEDPSMRAALSGVDLLPTIKNYINGGFDGNLVATIVGSPDLRKKHVDALVQLVVTNAFDGIDIDYERVPATSRADFTAFVELLATKLHASGKLLSVTVSAKSTESTRNGPGAQDWAAIGRVADSVKVMAYDKHWSTSAAGPIAPLDWLDTIAAYAENTIAKSEIIIGLPWYGYDWAGTSGESVTYSEAMTTAQRNAATVTHDVNGEATYSYAGRTVFFQDAESYRRKVDAIAKKHRRIDGFAHWRVGSEDPAVWDVVAELRSGDSAPVQQKPPQDFTLDGPATLSLHPGTIAAAEVSIVPINGFDGEASVWIEPLGSFDGAFTLSTTKLRVGSSAILRVGAPLTTPAGTYRIRVLATSGSMVRQHVIEIVVSRTRRRSVR